MAALVQAGTVSTLQNGTSIAPSLSGVSAGNLVICRIVYWTSPGTGTAQQIGAQAGWTTAYNSPPTTENGRNNSVGIALYHKLAASAGVHSASFTLPAGSYATAQISEYSGTGLAFDQVVANLNAPAGTTASTAISTGTLASSSSIIIAACEANDTTGFANIGLNTPTGFTSTALVVDTVNFVAASYAHKLVTGSTAVQTAAFTTTQAEVSLLGIIAAFSEAVAPTITAQPVQQTVAPNATATFTVAATPSGGTLTYQWRKNGSNISGANAASYTTPAATLADRGASFDCAVTDSNGTTISAAAALFLTGQNTGRGAAQPAWLTKAHRIRGGGGMALLRRWLDPANDANTSAGPSQWTDWQFTPSGTPTGVNAEGLSAADTQSASQVAAANLTETVAANDASGSQAILASSVAESAGASDASAATAAFAGAMAEAFSSADATTAQQSAGVSLAETLSLAETASAAQNHLSAASETAAASETVAASGVASSAQAETVGVVDAPAASSGAAVSALETSAVVDASASTQTATRSSAEGAAVSDSTAAVQQATASIAETFVVSDNTASTTGATVAAAETVIFSEAATATQVAVAGTAESTAAADSVAVTLAGSVAIAETVSATDAASAVGFGQAAVAENVSPVEAISAISIAAGVMNEALAPAEVLSASQVSPATQSESTSANESAAAGSTASSNCAETSAATDAASATGAAAGSVSELLTATEWQTSVGIWVGLVAENVTILDRPRIPGEDFVVGADAVRVPSRLVSALMPRRATDVRVTGRPSDAVVQRSQRGLHA